MLRGDGGRGRGRGREEVRELGEGHEECESCLAGQGEELEGEEGRVMEEGFQGRIEDFGEDGRVVGSCYGVDF